MEAIMGTVYEEITLANGFDGRKSCLPMGGRLVNAVASLLIFTRVSPSLLGLTAWGE
jgi:hypothetical protein